MGDQTNPFGRPDAAEPGWAASGRSTRGSGDRRAQRTVAAVLAVAVVATVAAISAEVAGIAPFGDSRAATSALMSSSAAASGAVIEAAASDPTPTDLTQPSGSPIFPPPTGQWLSQGTVVSEQRTNDPAGSVLVRAWTFKDICRRGSCHTESSCRPGQQSGGRGGERRSAAPRAHSAGGRSLQRGAAAAARPAGRALVARRGPQPPRIRPDRRRRQGNRDRGARRAPF